MKSFGKFLQSSLNEEQRKAVMQKKGAILVVAGAGSGKTRVITARIAHLILKQKVDPHSIVALTFTNKAAGEMKGRLYQFLGINAILPFVGTFHAYCLLLLKSNPSIAPHPDFTILDADDQIALIKKIIKREHLEKQISASQIAHHISTIKNKLRVSRENITAMRPVIRDIYQAYESEKAASKTLDFDDLLFCGLRMFERHQDFRTRFQEKISHILVDEYQDTNIVQHELLKRMAQNTKQKLAINSITAVGDEDQSIYSWRGAAPANILKFEQDFAPITKIKIEQNYRSATPILTAANTVIAHNEMRNPKKLWSTKKGKNRIMLAITRSEYQEAETIAMLLKSLPKTKSLNDVGILYRTHFQSRVLEEMLIAHSIPYRIIGGIHFYARKEIKDLLAYLHLIVNPHDRISFYRVINIPPRGLGQKFEELIIEQWQEHPMFDFKQMLNHLYKKKSFGIQGKKAEAIKQFLAIFTKLEKTISVSRALDIVLRRSNYLDYLRHAYDTKEAETKIENVREFVQSTFYFEQQRQDLTQIKTSDTSQKTLESFLNEIALLQEKSEDRGRGNERVRLMTLHAAKGLEFDTVVIVGLEDGLFPSSKSLHSFEALEEERRLFYVGMTRAKEYLFLSHALYRNIFGQTSDQVGSRFIDELPQKIVQIVDLSEHETAAAQPIFARWINPKKIKRQTTEKKVATTNTTHKELYKSIARAKQSVEQRTRNNKKNIKVQPAQLWKNNQAVLHKKFGAGIVIDTQKKNNNEWYITAIFKCGTKKVLSRFLTQLPFAKG